MKKWFWCLQTVFEKWRKELWLSLSLYRIFLCAFFFTFIQLVNKKLHKKILKGIYLIQTWCIWSKHEMCHNSSFVWIWSFDIYGFLLYKCVSSLRTATLWLIIIKMKNNCNLIGWNSVLISDDFNCYNANINEIWNAKKLGGIFESFEFILT